MKITTSTFVYIILGAVLFLGGVSYMGVSFDAPSDVTERATNDSNNGNALHSYPNFNDDEILVGTSHYLFVVRIKEQIGNEMRRDEPHTQFLAEVIYNIKGNTTGDITLNVKDSANLGLEIGHAYAISTRRGKTSKYYYVIPHHMAVYEVGDAGDLTDKQLKTLARSDKRVHELFTAYPNEKVLEADISHDLARNAFRFLSSSEQQEVFEKFEDLIPPQPVPTVRPIIPTPEPTVPDYEIQCYDGIDGDRDGFADVDDPDCSRYYREDLPAFCRDRVDNDRDGLIDAEDPDCAEFYPGE